MASEILKSELDLFKKVSFQGAIENSQIIQYRPITALSETSAIEFDIPISPDEYLDLQNIYLWIRGKVVQQNNAVYPAAQDKRYSLINYALFTIFDQLDVTLAGTLVTQSSKTFQYQSFIEALTQSTSLAALTYLEAAGFNSNFGTAKDFDNISEDLFKNVKRSKEFTLYGRLHGSIFNSDRLLLNGVPVHLTFTRANPRFCVMGRPIQVADATATPVIPALDATEPKFQLLDISLFARKVKLSPNLLNAHARAIQISKAVYPIKRPVMNIGANKTISQPAIELSNYPKGFCLYAFNFNSDFENANENEYINIPKDGYLNIEIRFGANIQNALKLICYALFDNTIEIDENRNVTIDYA